jgi:hypothetical protein
MKHRPFLLSGYSDATLIQVKNSKFNTSKLKELIINRFKQNLKIFSLFYQPEHWLRAAILVLCHHTAGEML